MQRTMLTRAARKFELEAETPPSRKRKASSATAATAAAEHSGSAAEGSEACFASDGVGAHSCSARPGALSPASSGTGRDAPTGGSEEAALKRQEQRLPEGTEADVVGVAQDYMQSQLLALGFLAKRQKLELPAAAAEQPTAADEGQLGMGPTAERREQALPSVEPQVDGEEGELEEEMLRIAEMKAEAGQRQRDWEIEGYCKELKMEPAQYEKIRRKLVERPAEEQVEYLIQLIAHHDATERAQEEEKERQQRQLEAQPHKVYGMVDVAAVIPRVRAMFNPGARNDISLKHVRTELEARLGLCLKSQKARIRTLVEKFMAEERAELAAAAVMQGGVVGGVVAAMAQAAAQCSGLGAAVALGSAAAGGSAAMTAGSRSTATVSTGQAPDRSRDAASALAALQPQSPCVAEEVATARPLAVAGLSADTVKAIEALPDEAKAELMKAMKA